MDRRKRVEAIMSSKLFKEELERVVQDIQRESGAEGITNLLSEMNTGGEALRKMCSPT